MTPSEQIVIAESELKNKVISIIERSEFMKEVNQFMDSTGLMVHSMHVAFLDASNLDKKEIILGQIYFAREQA